MPAIDSGKVLVSGSSGFLATWVCKVLLEQGFSVRGTVRSAEKGEYLKKLFAIYNAKFEYVIVEDIEKDGAFDEAVKGVDAIEHTASPAHLHADDPEELIGPAVQGTVGMLKSVAKNAPDVKRVVITSSCATIAGFMPPTEDVTILTESNWNETSVQVVKEKGKDADYMEKYRASKVLAERAAWEFMEKEKSNINFDLVVLNPPLVWGPIIHELSSPKSLNASLNLLYEAVKTNQPNAQLLFSWKGHVDVRDVAKAHLKAITVPNAGGKRIIVNAAAFCMQDALDALNEAGVEGVPKGQPGAGKNVIHKIVWGNSAAKEVLGMDFIPFDQCARDTLASFRSRGW